MCPRNHFTVLFILSCLLNYTNAQFRVINGEDIRIEKIPHSVAIFSDGVYRCVGALVNMNSVVTAAHCVISEEQDKLVVVAGVTDLRHRCSRSERRRGQRRNVQHIHHDYDPPTKLMDIAVVKVDESFEENNAVKPILLCDQQLVPGETMQVSGWGWISRTSGDYSHHLKTKHVGIVDTQECKSAYANKPNPLKLSETIICAGCGRGDVCFGDSGAAGVLNNRLCAVVKGGSGTPNVPDRYTDVTNERVKRFITTWM